MPARVGGGWAGTSGMLAPSAAAQVLAPAAAACGGLASGRLAWLFASGAVAGVRCGPGSGTVGGGASAWQPTRAAMVPALSVRGMHTSAPLTVPVSAVATWKSVKFVMVRVGYDTSWVLLKAGSWNADMTARDVLQALADSTLFAMALSYRYVDLPACKVRVLTKVGGGAPRDLPTATNLVDDVVEMKHPEMTLATVEGMAVVHGRVWVQVVLPQTTRIGTLGC